MKNRSVLFALAVLLAGAFQFAPSHAASGAVCQLAGTVHLSHQTSLTNSTKGDGTFSPGAALICAGSVSGQGSVVGTGNFYFCKHNYGVDVNPACHGPGYNGTGVVDQGLDPAFDNINGITGQGLVADFVGAESFSGFASGGTCAMAFRGHAMTAQAEIQITQFDCGNDITGANVPNMTGISTASSAFVVLPCGTDLCFQDVVFLGTITLSA